MQVTLVFENAFDSVGQFCSESHRKDQVQQAVNLAQEKNNNVNISRIHLAVWSDPIRYDPIGSLIEPLTSFSGQDNWSILSKPMGIVLAANWRIICSSKCCSNRTQMSHNCQSASLSFSAWSPFQRPHFFYPSFWVKAVELVVCVSCFWLRIKCKCWQPLFDAFGRLNWQNFSHRADRATTFCMDN